MNSRNLNSLCCTVSDEMSKFKLTALCGERWSVEIETHSVVRWVMKCRNFAEWQFSSQYMVDQNQFHVMYLLYRSRAWYSSIDCVKFDLLLNDDSKLCLKCRNNTKRQSKMLCDSLKQYQETASNDIWQFETLLRNIWRYFLTVWKNSKKHSEMLYDNLKQF